MLVALLLLLVFTLTTTVVSIFSSIPGVMANNTRMMITSLLFFMTVGLGYILTLLNICMVFMAWMSSSIHKSGRQKGNQEFHFD